MLELIFSRDSKNKESNSYLFSIMCLAVLKVIVSIICSKGKMGFIFHTSFLTFIINFMIVALIQVPKDRSSKEFMDKASTVFILVLIFLFLHVMGGLAFMLISKFHATSIPEGVLYFLNFLSLGAWLALGLTMSDEPEVNL